MSEYKLISHSKPTIENDDIKAVEEVLHSEMIASWKKVKEFENELQKNIGGVKAYASISGKSALILGLLTLGIEPGDEIILPTYVCSSVMHAVSFVKAKSVIVDIDDDYCISLEEIKKNITKKTKAIVIVHIFGISAKIKEVIKLCKEYKICIIEDCAQSIGGEIEGKKLGSFGDMAIFSFHATKVLTCGEGGMLLINNESLLSNIAKNVVNTKSEFFAMSDIQAALGLNQLKKLSEFIKKRRLLAKKYIELLMDFPGVDVPVRDMEKSIFFRFPVRIKKVYDFELLQRKMEKYGIQIRKGVDLMLHQVVKHVKCPNADKVYNENISLPIYPALDISEIEIVVERLNEVL